MVGARTDRQAQLDALQATLQTLDADLADQHPHGLVDELVDALDQLEELGVTRLMTPAESVRVSNENLPSMLDERAGVEALRIGLRVGARIIGAIRDTGLHDWWEGVEPEVLIASDADSLVADQFDRFADRLATELAMTHNVASFTPARVRGVEHERLLPPVHSVVTNRAEFREWALSWDGQALWCDPTSDGFRLQLIRTFGSEPPELAGDVDAAVERAVELLASETSELDMATITVTEHRALEVVVTKAAAAADDLQLSDDDRVRLDVLIKMLQLQLRTPTPDRTIIGRVLSGLAGFGGGVLVGVLGNYLTGLLQRFGMPWP